MVEPLHLFSQMVQMPYRSSFTAQKVCVALRSRVQAISPSGNIRKPQRLRAFEYLVDQYDEHEDHTEQRDSPTEPLRNSIDILFR
jgi:hypothetical protein